MKKTFKTFAIALTCLTAFSCTDETMSANQEKNEDLQSSAMYSRDGNNEFLNDRNLQIIIEEMPTFKQAMTEENYEQYQISSNKIANASNNLVDTYGETQLFINLDNLISENPEPSPDGEHDGDKCTRNLNGTVYWGQCNTWESIKATISIFFSCGGAPSGPNAMEEAEEWYKCQQGEICETC